MTAKQCSEAMTLVHIDRLCNDGQARKRRQLHDVTATPWRVQAGGSVYTGPSWAPDVTGSLPARPR